MSKVSLFVRRAARKLGNVGRRDYTLIEGRLSEAIGQHHFTLTRGLHPHERATMAALANPHDAEAAIRETLGAYYSRVWPRNPAEWLNVPDLPPALVDAPSYAVTFPWHANSPARWMEVRANGIPQENKLAGDELPLEHGWNACGPVSDRKLGVETRRVHSLFNSIREKGLIRHAGRDGDIEAVMLRTTAGERWWINSGHHRAPVLAALGYETVPVRIRQVFDVADVETWPQVKSGLFTPAQAVLIVDRLIAGELPPIINPWTDWLQTADVTRLAS